MRSLIQNLHFLLVAYFITSCATYSIPKDYWVYDVNEIRSLVTKNTVEEINDRKSITLFSLNSKYFKINFSGHYKKGINRQFESYEVGTWEAKNIDYKKITLANICLKKNGKGRDECHSLLRANGDYHYDEYGQYVIKIFQGENEIIKLITKNMNKIDKNRYRRILLDFENVNGKTPAITSELIKTKKETIRTVSSKKAIKPKIECKSIDINKEKIACYAVIVGPKLCTEVISKNEDTLTNNIGGRAALGIACTQGVYSHYAKKYVTADLIGNLVDEATETACSDRNTGGALKWTIGALGCGYSGVSWIQKLSLAHSCVVNIEDQCE